MKTSTAVATPPQWERAIRDQIERIVSSVTFSQSDRLKHFISFVAGETLQKRGDTLKEYIIGVQVFGRDPAFDPRTDPVVRVQARRLRARLDRYYRDQGQHDPIRIHLPKGGYVPNFRQWEGANEAQPVSAPSAQPNTIAILPFADQTGEQEISEFASSLTDAIVSRLMELKELRVVAPPHGDRTSALRLQGTLRRAREGVRLTIGVVDLATGCYLFHESAPVHSTDTFAVQDEMAAGFVKRLRQHLPRSPKGELRTFENLAARNLCKQGFYHLEQRTADSMERAADLFERAIVEDAQYSSAHSGLADTYSLLASCGVRPAITLSTLALSSAATAVMLDSRSCQALTSLANAKARAHWNWLEAEIEFQRAIRADESYATAHNWYARSCLLPLQRLDQALEECLIAQSLDPVSSIIGRDVALIHYYRRDFDTALVHCDHAVELNPYFHCAYFVLGLVQQELGDVDEALAAFQRGVELAPKAPQMIAGLGWAMANAGRYDEALSWLGELDELAKTRYVAPFERAILLLGMEDVDRCFEQLALADKDRYFDLTTIAIDPRFDPIRSDPRFVALAQKIGVA